MIVEFTLSRANVPWATEVQLLEIFGLRIRTDLGSARVPIFPARHPFMWVTAAI